MGHITYYSYRIYKQNRLKFNEKEFESLKSFTFNSPFYHIKNDYFRSRWTPVIFELTDEDLCIEVQYDIYSKDLVTLETLEKLYELCYPFYEFWFITSHESTDYDYIYCNKYLEQNAVWEEPQLFFEDAKCEYMYDSIMIETLGEIPKELSHIKWFKAENEYRSEKIKGKYNSNSQKSGQSKMISLADKYNQTNGGIELVSVENEWYSDNILKDFLDTEFKATSISKMMFFFKGRKVREIIKDDYLECKDMLCYDGWDNCCNDIYLNYMKKRQ